MVLQDNDLIHRIRSSLRNSFAVLKRFCECLQNVNFKKYLGKLFFSFFSDIVCLSLCRSG